jgi:hypothetical protein
MVYSLDKENVAQECLLLNVMSHKEMCLVALDRPARPNAKLLSGNINLSYIHFLAYNRTLKTCPPTFWTNSAARISSTVPKRGRAEASRNSRIRRCLCEVQNFKRGVVWRAESVLDEQRLGATRDVVIDAGWEV